jgi:integrase
MAGSRTQYSSTDSRSVQGSVPSGQAGGTVGGARIRSFRAIVKRAGLNEDEWTPREMRHSFVSLLSDSGVPVENIARLVGHVGGSAVTETVYLKQIRPVLLEGAEAMDRLFGGPSAA